MVRRLPTDSTQVPMEIQSENLTDSLEASCAISVEGLNPTIGRDVLEMFFESERRSGGGKIVNMQINQKSRRAIIWFADEGG